MYQQTFYVKGKQGVAELTYNSDVNFTADQQRPWFKKHQPRYHAVSIATNSTFTIAACRWDTNASYSYFFDNPQTEGDELVPSMDLKGTRDQPAV